MFFGSLGVALRSFVDFTNVRQNNSSKIKRQIERGEAKFDKAPSGDSGEPSFLEGWQDAEEAIEFLRASAFCRLLSCST